MSRCYRIRVSEAIERHIHVDDGLQSQLELLDILPAPEMAALLAQQLEERGYEQGETEHERIKTLENGVVVVVDVENGQVHIGLTDEADVSLSAERNTVAVDVDPNAVEEQLRKTLTSQLEAGVDAERQALRLEVTRKLEASLDGVRGELDDAVNRATAEALKQKARTLGEVTEIHEDPESGSVTIRVKV